MRVMVRTEDKTGFEAAPHTKEGYVEDDYENVLRRAGYRPDDVDDQLVRNSLRVNKSAFLWNASKTRPDVVGYRLRLA